jgi:hypothetical protein
MHAYQNIVNLRETRNEATRVHAVCCEGCTSFIKVSGDNKKEAIVVKKHEPNHTCESIWELKALTAPFLTHIS